MTPDDEALIEYLAERELPCPRCGYNLRGLTAPQCPECGNRLELKVGLTQPFLRAWIAALSAVLLPAGIGLMLIIGLIRQGTDLFRYADTAERLAMLGFGISPLLAIGLLGFRRGFLKLHKTGQYWIAAAAIGFATLLFGWMLMQIF